MTQTLATLQPSGGRREAIARLLYKSRGMFDDETVRMHFEWFHTDKTASAEHRQSIVHCYRDADTLLASGLVQDEAATISDDWIMNIVRYSTVGSGAVPKSEWCAFARAMVAALDVTIRADEREKQRNRDAEISHHYFESLGPKKRWPLEKMQAGFAIAAAIRSARNGGNDQ